MTPMKKFAFWLQGLALSIALLCIATESHEAEHQHQKIEKRHLQAAR
jgi:hypothetical protein